MNRFPYITGLLISLIVFSYPQTLLSQEKKLAVVASVRGMALSVDFDPVTSIVAVDLGEGNVVFVGPGENTTLDMGAGNVVRVEVPDSGVGVLLNVVSGDIEVWTPTGDVINMDAGDGAQVSETEAGDTAIFVTATGEDGRVTVDTNAGVVAMDVGDAVEVGEARTDGSVEVTVISGEVTLAIDAGDVTMDVGDVVTVTESIDGVGLEIISGEVTLETGTGDVVMDAGDDVVISVDSESGNAEIEVVGGDGVDVVDANTGETVTIEVGGGVVVQIVVDEGDNEGRTDFGADVMGDAEVEGEVGVTDESVVFTTDFDESDTTVSYVSAISESSNTNTYTEPDSDGAGDNGDEYPNDPTEDGDGDDGSSYDDSHADNGIHRGNEKEDRHEDKGKHKSEGMKKHGLTDNIVDPPDASMDYLLTFAKMIRGDMDIHNEEYPDDAASQSGHQPFIEEVNDINISLNSIEEEMEQAKAFLNEHIYDFGDTAAHNNIRFQIDSALVKIDTDNNNNYIASTIDSIRSENKKAFRNTIDHMNGVGLTNKYRSQELTRRVSSSIRGSTSGSISGSRGQPHKPVNSNRGVSGISNITNPGRKAVGQSKNTKKH
ncbi:MAG: hypothetical protein ACUZ9M_04895 [Candidatus Scalindua sp.]